MSKLLSAAAFAAGIWLIYLGYERQQSIAGKTDSTLSAIGQRIDGEGHTPTHIVYYAAGAVMFAAGAYGLGIVKK
jgi:glyoxylase-like metal-dependent hydrolase (beta-lactamase superfamily II)